MSEQVDDFLAHYGIPGMKWGKRKSQSGSSTTKPKMSRKKKIAIAVGVGAVVAVGAVIAVKSLNKNAKLPVENLVNRPEFKKGEQASKQAPPKSNSNSSAKPKAPSPYPMTPLIKTPVLDELLKKYNPSTADLEKAAAGIKVAYDSSSGRYVKR